MTDFAEPFRRGLDAAQRAATNRAEVRALFERFNDALSEMSEGSAEICIAETFKSSILKFVTMFDKDAPKDLVLAVRNPKHGGFALQTIAKWRQADEGYPCTVSWSDRHASCDSVAALQEELSALFGSPKVGEAIAAAMRFQPPAPPLPATDIPSE